MDCPVPVEETDGDIVEELEEEADADETTPQVPY